MITVPSTWRAARPVVWISEMARAQKAFFVGVKDRHQRHLGQVEPFAQQVDADHHIVHAQPQVAQDLTTLERIDIGVQVLRADTHLFEVIRQLLGHALGQRRHQRALPDVDALLDLAEQVVDLALASAARRSWDRPGRSAG